MITDRPIQPEDEALLAASIAQDEYHRNAKPGILCSTRNRVHGI